VRIGRLRHAAAPPDSGFRGSNARRLTPRLVPRELG